MKWVPRSLGGKLGCLGCFGIAGLSLVVCIFLTGVATFPLWLPGPILQQHKTDVAWEWGQFAPLPESAANFHIDTSGSPFTRTFSGSFSADRKILEQWIKDSPGLEFENGEKLGSGKIKYVITPGGGAGFGYVEFDSTAKIIIFTISWS